MKCDNNSIYELQDRLYQPTGYPLVIFYETLDNISQISKIHSRQLIIFFFSVFCQKKKEFANVSKKMFYTINTAKYGIAESPGNYGLSISSDGWDIRKNPISAKKYKKV